MENIRNERLVALVNQDRCSGGCGALELRAAIECSTGAIKAWCVDARCSAYSRSHYLQKRKYLAKNWPDEILESASKTKEKRDPRFVIPFDREQFVYARDTQCAHCPKVLSEDVAALPLKPEHPYSAPPQAAESLTLFKLPSIQPVKTSQQNDLRLRPSRVPRPRSLDHIVPYWAGRLIAEHLDERSVELIGVIAVVASCPGCNSRRQFRDPKRQLLHEAAANDLIAGMQQLLASRILIEGSVDPIADQIRFTEALSLLRKLLTGRALNKRTAV